MKNRLIFCLVLLISCNSNYTPKPRALFKLELPNKTYKKIITPCPFSFDIPTYSHVISKKGFCFFDIIFPDQSAKIHITYFPLSNDLYAHTEESRRLAYKHNVIADGITEQLYVNDSLNVYAILYDYIGVTATSIQFSLTDSVNHFFRGALYFNSEINDSITPVNNFLKEDVRHIIESFSWKR